MRPRKIRKNDGLYLEAILSGATMVVVVGVGSLLRGDDAAGVLVARAISKRKSSGGEARLIAVDGGTAPENITSVIIRAHPSHVVFIDAADMGLDPGEAKIIAKIIGRSEIGGMSFSTHSLPLTVIANYLEKSINCEVSVIGIQPESTAFGARVSPAVRRAVKATADDLMKALP